MGKQRSSNFELLRIITMLMIVFHHFGVHGGFEFATETISFNRLWIQFISIGGRLGVNIFVLISGYFLTEAQSLKWKKVFKMLAQLIFYSVTIYMLSCVVGGGTFSVTKLLQSFFPVTFQTWWFASTYFVMYLLFPFINIFLKNMSQQIYQKFLLTLFVIWCLIPTFTTESYQCSYLLWFIFLYAIAAYVRIYGVWKLSASKYLFLGCGAVLLTFLSAVVMDVLGLWVPAFAQNAMYFYEMQKLPTFLSSVLLFLGFEAMNLKHIPLINTVASAAFGVYLIHDHVLVREFLWGKLLPLGEYGDSPFLAVYSVAVVLVVFGVCIGIELLRIHTVEKGLMRIFDKMEIKHR